ncbi:MAG TPA: GNAT family N-acetyltransferase, partial [Pseudogracilibacillus sp.]|nr:GNAT family N-acetyltransferase [Pseudogracilibacillus sp.]
MIREMVKEDIEQVQEVARNSWSTTYEGIIPYQIQENFLNRAYNDEMMEKRVGQSYIFVAEKENRIVGFANFT